RGRGISERTVGALRLGYGAPGLAAALESRDLDLDVARALGLLSGERERFCGRIIVPDCRGRHATWLTGRSIDGREPRYLNLRREKPLLGLSRIAGPAVVLSEGPFDWLTAVEWGLPAVALLGTRLSRQLEHRLDRFERIYLALDNDSTGRLATHELAGRLGRRAIPVELPPGATDLNDLQRRPNGRAEFLRCLREAASRKEKSWTVDATGFTRRAA
ncbi:MAG: toprim domain-containing protein, partial [Dehalococcoidia bacterium]